MYVCVYVCLYACMSVYERMYVQGTVYQKKHMISLVGPGPHFHKQFEVKANLNISRTHFLIIQTLKEHTLSAMCS